MPSSQPEEAKGFKLLGHDRSAAWGGGSIVEVHKGYAYVGSVGTSSGHAPPSRLDQIDEEVQSQVRAAVEFALNAPYPELSEVTEHVYA